MRDPRNATVHQTATHHDVLWTRIQQIEAEADAQATHREVLAQLYFSAQISSFYVKDGSYTRLRNLQVGYNVPARFVRWVGSERFYLQAENLFTITGYDGLDPSLPSQSITGAAGDLRDQYRGIDRGSYPSNRMFSIGLVTSF